MNCIAIAIDSFKGSLSSQELANSIKKGILRVYQDLDIKIFPLADGGEGTLESINGKMVPMETFDALKEKITSEYLITTPNTAIIESAKIIGLNEKTKKNFLKTSSFGLGVVIKEALEKGIQDITITLGGTATNDAGAGMLEALGYRFFDNQDKIISPNSSNLINISKIDGSLILEKLKKTNFTVAVDVDAKMYGKNGCTKVFSPQKGAKEEDLKLLEEGIKHFCSLIKKTTDIDVSDTKGVGAGGCIAGSLKAFLNAKIISGVDFILKNQYFEEKIKECDLVITGEGKIDSQTSMGKAILGVVKNAKKRKIPVIAICAIIDENPQNIHALGIDAIFSIIDKPLSIEEAIKPKITKKMVENLSEEIFRLIKLLP